MKEISQIWFNIQRFLVTIQQKSFSSFNILKERRATHHGATSVALHWHVPDFSTRRKIAAYSAKHPGTIHRPEASGNFLMDFRHPDVIFAPVVREWNQWIIHEAKGFLFVIPQPFKEVACFRAFQPSSLSFFAASFIRRRAFDIALFEDIPVAIFE